MGHSLPPSRECFHMLDILASSHTFGPDIQTRVPSGEGARFPMLACGTALRLKSLSACSLTEPKRLFHRLKAKGRARYVSACFNVGQGEYMPPPTDDAARGASAGGYLASGTYVPVRELIFMVLRGRRYVSRRHTRANQGPRLVFSNSAFARDNVRVDSIEHRGMPSLWRGAGAEKGA